MTTLEASIEAIERVDALLKWRGMDEPTGNSNPISESTKRVQKLLATLQEIDTSACREHNEIVDDTNERCAKYLKALIQSRTSREVIGREIALLEAVIENVAEQRRAYSELIRKLNGCIEEITRDASTIADEAKQHEASRTSQLRLHSVRGRALDSAKVA